MDGKKNIIGIVTPPIGLAGIPPLSNLVDIIIQISNPVLVITGNVDLNPSKNSNSVVIIEKIRSTKPANPIWKIINHIIVQLKMSYSVLKSSGTVDTWIFFIDSHALILPIITAKITRKKIFILLAASIKKSSHVQKNYFTDIILFQERISLKIADLIILYSRILVTEWDMVPYQDKIVIAKRHFINFSTFREIIPFSQRQYTVGYIGRLSKEKGVQNFIDAIPAILRQQRDLKILLIGDGPLRNTLDTTIISQQNSGRIDLPGWIAHEDLPQYLNQLRLVIIPSYSEGLPNIMLEAMACGTPVLVTPVGVIPDIIIDGKTGFIMKDNSPECIIDTMNRVLNHPDLSTIARNAREHVEENFTFEKSLITWKKVFDEI